MCGIAGFKVNHSTDPEVLKKMLKKLVHRGPDSDGFFRSGSYQGGMRRLAINDLTTGNQPLFNEDRSIALLYNGEIYNAPELRKDLKKKGYQFSTHSDGEVICHLYQEIGDQVFEKLDGMFAVALWSEKEKKLILARDIPGEKPLYYYQLSDQEIVFASELKSLICFPDLDLSLNHQAIWDFATFLWVPQPETVYQKIKSLPPAHFLSLDQNGIQIHSYLNKFGSELRKNLNEEELVEETRRVVTDAITSRLLSDVPVGCFLSGGLDSSIVTSVAAKNLPSLTTFTIAFEDVSDPYHGMANESLQAEWYAKMLGTKHVTVQATAKSFRDSLETFCYYGDQPFAVSSGLGILAISKEAKRHGIKVLLSGDGADECFGGYSWYPFLASLPDEAPDSDSSEVSFYTVGIDLASRVKAIHRHAPGKRAWAWHYYASEEEKLKLFSQDFRKGIKTSLRFFSNLETGNSSPEDFIRHDRNFYFPNEMLQKLDRMTMAHSVEGRVPFAAPSVQRFANRLKYHDLIRGETLKWILRKAFAPLLPQEILERPKHGFNVPIDHWLKGGWNDLFLKTFAKDSALVKGGILSHTSSHVATKMLNDSSKINGHTLFTFVMLNLWLEINGNHC